jgi:acetylglutamate kinase
MKKFSSQASILIEALPYIKAFSGKTMVLKCGGSWMEEEELVDAFVLDVVLMWYVGMKPVIIHGGGPQISQIMERFGKSPKFIDGQRITDEETMELVEMVLGGRLNKELVSRINHQGGRAVGLSGIDSKLLEAKKHLNGKIDLGFVGEVKKVNPQIISSLDDDGFIPVIAPIGIGDDGKRYNINADWAASEIASALKAEKLIVLTDTRGVLKDEGDENSVISTLTLKQIDEMIENNTIKGGMIPKLRAAQRALKNGVCKVHIIDGRVLHSTILELFTDKGIGTQIVA